MARPGRREPALEVHSQRSAAAVPNIPVSRLWTVFVLGWLLVPAATASMLTRAEIAVPRLVLAELALLLLAALYLWVTLRASIDPSDFGPDGPEGSAVRRRLLWLGVMTLAVLALVLLVPHAEVWWLIMHVVVAAGLALPPALATGVIAGLVAATVAGAWLASGSFDALLLILVAFGAGAIAIRQLTISVAQLHAAREELARAAVDRERLRFARDLHDLLGHSLSLIIIKSELARRLLPASPSEAAVEVSDAERAAREALREVRTAVVGYRQPVLDRELAAARELLAAAGIDATLQHSAGALPVALDGLLAWAVREGVTNVIRHSRARRCEIRVSRIGAVAELVVSDDGRGTAAASFTPGSGLSGLAERAATHGAELRVGPRPGGGFSLVMTVPAAEAGAEDAR